jgi:hypothetical protein
MSRTMRRPLLAVSAMAMGLAGLMALPGPAMAVPRDLALLQGLDKVTARVKTFLAPIDQPVSFGSLTITARMCDRTPVTEAPESTAFLEIVEVLPGQDPRWVFSGWMFASSPAVSAMEHPVYDVRVLRCIDQAEAPEALEPEPVDPAPTDGIIPPVQ